MSLSDDLSKGVGTIISQGWTLREGKIVPTPESVNLKDGAVRLNATILYADLAQSSELATEFHQKTAAKVIRSFLYCMCKIITANGGTITSFDGDRVMGIFVEGCKNTNSAKCALKMSYATSKIIRPKIENYFKNLKTNGFKISHCVGIDTSPILAVRTGQKGSNALVWVGRAPNLAAKLSEIREEEYYSYITEDVFSMLNDEAKYGGKDKKIMWEKRSFQYLGKPIAVYRSNWWWKP